MKNYMNSRWNLKEFDLEKFNFFRLHVKTMLLDIKKMGIV